MMTDTKRERMAKNLLGLFRDIWCDRESDDEPFFNCSKCEFELDDGTCVLKIFLKTAKYEDEYTQGAIAIEGGEDE